MQMESLQIMNRPGDNTGVGVTAVQLDLNGAVTTAPAFHKQGANLLHDKMIIEKEMLAASVANHVFICREGTWAVSAFSYIPRVAGSGGAATIDVRVTTGTQAPTSGTTQLSAALDLVGVADTLQNATIIATPTEVGPGARVSFFLTGTLTSVVGLAHLEIKRIR